MKSYIACVTLQFFILAVIAKATATTDAEEEYVFNIGASRPDRIQINAVHQSGLRRRLRSVGAFINPSNRDEYKLHFPAGSDSIIKLITNPKEQEFSIKIISSSNVTTIDEDDKAYFASISHALWKDDRLDTDTTEKLSTQFQRAANILSSWPTHLSVDFTFDKEAEIKRLANDNPRKPAPVDAPPVPPHPHQPRKKTEDIRQLATVSLCDNIEGFYEVTHDDWQYNRGNDRTTYWAYLNMAEGCGNDNYFTYFYKNTRWKCIEPDHSRTIEYAYGDCFGRCGAGCGDSSQFTKDCADHDSCVRFGHAIYSLWCDDEFTFTIDDALFAPNCY